MNVSHGGWTLRAESRSEPPFDGRGSDVFQSFSSNGVNPSVPHFGSADVGGGAGEDKFVQPLRSVGGEPHSDHPAHRQTAEVEAVKF